MHGRLTESLAWASFEARNIFRRSHLSVNLQLENLFYGAGAGSESDNNLDQTPELGLIKKPTL